VPPTSAPHSRSCPGRRIRSAAGDPGGWGFTILELLVAIAVLVLLVLLASQIVQSGTAVMSGGRKNLGADAQAREVFSRLAMDLAQMPKRADLDAIFSDQDGNKKFFFYSEAAGFMASATNQGTLALVGYRVQTNSGLERLGKGLTWSGSTSPVFLTYSSTSSNALAASTLVGDWSAAVGSGPSYDGTDSDYHLLAPSVFRLEYCFQKKDGTYSLTRDPSQGFHDLAAIVVTVAVLDGDSRKIAPSISKLADALPSPTAANLAANILPAELWQNIVNNNAAFAFAAQIPPAAAARVKIYQRAFPLRTQ